MQRLFAGIATSDSPVLAALVVMAAVDIFFILLGSINHNEPEDFGDIMFIKPT